MKRSLWGAGAGLVAGGVGVGLSEAVGAALPGVTSPVLAVANRVIDWTPRPLKEWAIEVFGDADKPVLLGSILIGMALGLLVAGVLGVRKTVWGVGAFALLALVAAATVVADRASTASIPVRLIPVLVLAVGAIGSLILLLRLLPSASAPAPEGFDRRKFLLAAGGMAGVAVASGAAGQTVLKAGTGRSSVVLPAASSPATALATGVQLDVPGITPFITPNNKFYRVDTAVRVPRVPVRGYTLRIRGMVDEPIELSFKELLDMPLVERRITLTCVSQPVGGTLIGNATWLGVDTKTLFARLGIQSGADAVKTTSVDGMTIGTPLEALTDDRGALIAVGMNGEPLPLEHGFPVRMIVPGLYGYVSATKWLREIEVTRFADFKAYWTTRGYSAEAPIKTGTRIDVPKSFARVSPGKLTVGGVSWAQDRGITKVEVSYDGGEWQEATLAKEDNISTWRQWSVEIDVEDGNRYVQARAYDSSGEVQTSETTGVAPDGATGLPRKNFTVE